MPSYVKLLEEYLASSEIQTLQSDYNTEDKHNEMSLEEKSAIADDFLQYQLMTIFRKVFGVKLNDQLTFMGSGTQGFVVAFQTFHGMEGFETLAKQSLRTRGPFGDSYPTEMAVKVQLIPKASSYAEKRILREEYIMEYLNRTPSNASLSAPSSIVRNAIPKLYFGCTIPFRGAPPTGQNVFFRLTFMECITPKEYMTLEQLMLTNTNFVSDVVYQNIESLVKALWRLGVSHNDLSMRNIMARYTKVNNGEVKLLDFGLADVFKIDLSHASNAHLKQEYENIFLGNTTDEQRDSNVTKLRELCGQLALYGKTWYEKHFKARIKDEDIRRKYNADIAKLNSTKALAYEDFDFLYQLNDERARKAYDNSRTYTEFFANLSNLMEKQEFCMFLSPWLEDFIRKHVFSMDYLAQTWVISVDEIHPVKLADGKYIQILEKEPNYDVMIGGTAFLDNARKLDLIE